MPLPVDDALDATIERLYDAVLDRAAQPGQFGIITGHSAQLQAASQRRLVAIEKATEAQNRTARAQEETNHRIEKLERVGIWIAGVGVFLAVVQIGIAIWPTVWPPIWKAIESATRR